MIIYLSQELGTNFLEQWICDIHQIDTEMKNALMEFIATKFHLNLPLLHTAASELEMPGGWPAVATI